MGHVTKRKKSHLTVGQYEKENGTERESRRIVFIKCLA